MERASSTTLQGPRDDNIVALLYLTVFLSAAMSVMLFVEKVIILVKLFRKRPERHPERQYIWEPMHEKEEILVQIPMFEGQAHNLSIGGACRVSWTSDRVIIQVLDDSTDPVIKECNKEEEVIEDENERNQEEETRTTEDENERNQEEEIRTTEEERKLQEKRRREGESKVEAKEKGKRKQEETGEGTVEVNEDEKEGREKKEAEMARQRKGKAKVNEDEKVGEKKQEVETVMAQKDGQERDGNRKEKTVGEVKVETTEEKERRKRRGDTLGERQSQAKRRKKAEVNQRKQQRRWVRRKKSEVNHRKQQRRWVRSCMAMGCAAIFTIVLIYLCTANIPEEETIYLVPT